MLSALRLEFLGCFFCAADRRWHIEGDSRWAWQNTPLIHTLHSLDASWLFQNNPNAVTRQSRAIFLKMNVYYSYLSGPVISRPCSVKSQIYEIPKSLYLCLKSHFTRWSYLILHQAYVQRFSLFTSMKGLKYIPCYLDRRKLWIEFPKLCCSMRPIWQLLLITFNIF